jgi:hypothetical protein
LRNFIIKLISFIIFSFLVYVILFSILNFPFKGKKLIYYSTDYYPLKGGATYQTFMDFDTLKSKCDIIILGSSHAYRGYDPRIFKSNGYSAYNLGTSGQTIRETNIIVKDNLFYKPRLIILDVYENSFLSDGFESAANLIQNVASDKTAMDLSLAMKDIRGLNLLAFRFFAKYSKPSYVDSNYVGSGYTEMKDSLKKPLIYERSRNQLIESQWECFRKMLDYFEEKKIAIVAVNHPSPNLINKENHLRFAKQIGEELKKRKILFFDYAYSHKLNSQNHFLDNNHLNQAGVNIFNSILIEDLKKAGIL